MVVGRWRQHTACVRHCSNLFCFIYFRWNLSKWSTAFEKLSLFIGHFSTVSAIYQTLPLVPKSSFFSKNGQKVRVYRFHFYLKNRKSKRETKTHARRMLPPPPHHHLCLILRRTQISWPKWNSVEKLPNVHCIYIKFTNNRFTEPHHLKRNWTFHFTFHKFWIRIFAS